MACPRDVASSAADSSVSPTNNVAPSPSNHSYQGDGKYTMRGRKTTAGHEPAGEANQTGSCAPYFSVGDSVGSRKVEETSGNSHLCGTESGSRRRDRYSGLETSRNFHGGTRDRNVYVSRRNLGLATTAVAGLVAVFVAMLRWGRHASRDSYDNSAGRIALVETLLHFHGFLVWKSFCVTLFVSCPMLVVGGLFWFAARLARWREEVFAWSPVVAEALSRASALRGTNNAYHSKDGPSGRLNECGDDPVGAIFGPGTDASRAFFVSASTSSTSDGAVVFLTGVTGLVGRMVLFDLLKQGAAISAGAGGGRKTDGDADGSRGGDGAARQELKRVLVLVRAKKGMSASQRLASIRDSPMFRPLRESGAWADEGEETEVRSTSSADASQLRPLSAAPGNPRVETSRGAFVTVVEGDLGKEALGLAGETRAILADAGVTHSLHCAASVSFSDPMAKAAAMNVTGALRVAALVASWPSCR